MLILTLPRYSCFELYASRGNTPFTSWYRQWPLCHRAAFAVTEEDPRPFDKDLMSNPTVMTFNGALTRLPWPWSSPLVDDVGWLLYRLWSAVCMEQWVSRQLSWLERTHKAWTCGISPAFSSAREREAHGVHIQGSQSQRPESHLVQILAFRLQQTYVLYTEKIIHIWETFSANLASPGPIWC